MDVSIAGNEGYRLTYMFDLEYLVLSFWLRQRSLCITLRKTFTGGISLKYFSTIALGLVVLGLLSGCATTTAPTESSTKTFDKTTNATLDATSSTSPGSSGSSSAGVEAFTQANFIALKGEMAAGEGEHLSALGGLLHVPANEEENFFLVTQNTYSQLYPSPSTTPQQMLVTLDDRLIAADITYQ